MGLEKRKTRTKPGNETDLEFVKPEKRRKLSRPTIRNDKDCEVCGEKARSHNFGGISCNSCRSFFHHYSLKNLRHSLSTNHLKKDCKFRGNCIIDKVSRKKCRTCRFFKCMKIGMDPAWVISDYERTQKLKGSKVSESTPLQAEQSLDSKTDQISEEDAKKIADISKYYKTACDLMPYNYVSREETEVLSVTKIRIIYIGVISTAIRRFVCFARMIPEFERLSLHDKTNLLRRSVVEMVILRDVVTFDFEKRNFYASECPDRYPYVRMDECVGLWPTDIVDMYLHLYRRIRTLAPDEATIMLMIPLALFSDCGGNDSCSEFDDRQEINKIQEFYAGLLEKYLKWLHGEEKGKLVFPRLLSQMVGITTVSQLHQGLPLNLTDDQVDKMHLHLLELQKLATTPSSNDTYFQDQSSLRQEDRGQKVNQCCQKKYTTSMSNISKSSEPSEINEHVNHPSLIHTFSNQPGQWGIKPYFFESGPHQGIEKAFMRRMTELVANPWDSLVSDVSRLSMSPTEDELCENNI
ncbi:nuclear receptor subfamily 1 group I member 3 [Folsomia candida]|uniref:Oxysterols receptor LXR-alpha n=1 Tax=Folsomia candida TaxID=158441 RepID=A0A226DH21_FOLCA|nr:nuclear receptor subfamily 1 group I member 3 [Folsomia candida]OXA44523.1 Oxysterols receptor LXR-alpha [Folsomia candida]